MSDQHHSLILLHGFAQTPQSWQKTIEALPESLDLQAIELPGHGATANTCGVPSVELARRFVLDAVDSAVNPRVVIWGYSQGARVAFDFAFNHPELAEALIVESGTPGIEDPIRRASRRSGDFALASRIAAGTIEQFVDQWERIPALGDQSKELIADQRADRLRHEPEALAAALNGIGQAAYESGWPRLGELGMPVLILTGERDRVYSGHGERLVAGLPDAKHLVIEDAAHAVHMAQPEAAAKAAAEFMAGLS